MVLHVDCSKEDSRKEAIKALDTDIDKDYSIRAYEGEYTYVFDNTKEFLYYYSCSWAKWITLDIDVDNGVIIINDSRIHDKSNERRLTFRYIKNKKTNIGSYYLTTGSLLRGIKLNTDYNVSVLSPLFSHPGDEPSYTVSFNFNQDDYVQNDKQ